MQLIYPLSNKQFILVTTLHVPINKCGIPDLNIENQTHEQRTGGHKKQMIYFAWPCLKVTGDSLHLEIFASDKLFVSPQGK